MSRSAEQTREAIDCHRFRTKGTLNAFFPTPTWTAFTRTYTAVSAQASSHPSSTAAEDNRTADTGTGIPDNPRRQDFIISGWAHFRINVNRLPPNAIPKPSSNVKNRLSIRPNPLSSRHGLLGALVLTVSHSYAWQRSWEDKSQPIGHHCDRECAWRVGGTSVAFVFRTVAYTWAGTRLQFQSFVEETLELRTRSSLCSGYHDVPSWSFPFFFDWEDK